MSKGQHTIKFGAEVDQQRSPNVFLPENNALPVFLAFSDLVANDPLRNSDRVGKSEPAILTSGTLAFYFQDDWGVKSNLTLNLGLRWEWYPAGDQSAA